MLGTGHTPDRANEAYWRDCTIPWVTVADIQKLSATGLEPLAETEQYISELGLRNSAAVLHPTGTVMLSRTASIGFSCRIGRPMATTQAFATWTPGDLVDSRYLLLAVKALKPELERIAYGSTHLTIYMPDIEQLRTPLPPLGTQWAIADWVETETARIDALITRKHEIIALMAERDVAMAHEAITGVSVPGPRQGSPVPWLGSLPSGWSLSAVSAHFDVQLGRMLNADRVSGTDLAPYARNVNIRWDRVDMSDVAKMDFPIADRPRYRLRKGDLLINEGGAGIGRSAIWNGELDECYFQKSVLRLRPLREANPRWMVECMRVAVARKVLLVEGNLATIPHLPAEALRVLRLPFPPGRVQDALLADLARNRARGRALVDKLGQQIELLQEHRQAVITAAVTGAQEIPTAE